MPTGRPRWTRRGCQNCRRRLLGLGHLDGRREQVVVLLVYVDVRVRLQGFEALVLRDFCLRVSQREIAT